MFTLNTSPTFNRVITVAVPVDGGHDNQTISVTYRAISDDEASEFDLRTLDGQKDFLRAVIASFDDMVDLQGNQVAYSASVRDQVLGLGYARNPLLKGYTDAMVPALVKN